MLTNKEKIVKLIEWPASIMNWNHNYLGLDIFGKTIYPGDRVFWCPKDVIDNLGLSNTEAGANYMLMKLETYVKKFGYLPDYTRMNQEIDKNREFNVERRSFRKSKNRFETYISDLMG